MDAWVTVVVAGIVALSTLGATFLQNWHSNKRFKIELGRAIDVDAKKRKWEVRSEPLIILRTALAKMATKLHILVTETQWSRNQSDITEETEKAESKESQQAWDDWRNYMTSGDFLLALNIQYDTELIKLVEEIEGNYRLLFEYALDYRKLKPEELKAFREISLNIKNKIPEVQEVIYKRLEEL